MKTSERTRRGRYRIAWTSQSAVKKVEIVDADSGRRSVGTDWASWDAAYHRALAQIMRQPA